MIRPNILVVCGKNKRRSRTAEHIFKNDNRFNIRSVGLSPKSNRKITADDLLWADFVFVMEPDQKTQIQDSFRSIDISGIEILYIEDDYEYMDEDLQEILYSSINSSIKRIFDI